MEIVRCSEWCGRKREGWDGASGLDEADEGR